MNNRCLRCNYEWRARDTKPLRCPRCKTTRWYKEVIKDQCKRCGAEWIQRGGEMPKYCPVCHSSMWNTDKRTYTCPKCGKTRILRSNSRENLCPECDMYSDKKGTSRTMMFPEKVSGINKIIPLWSDGKGLTLTCVDNGSFIASLYENGQYIGETNIDLFCRKYGLTFEIGPKLQTESFQNAMKSAVDKILFTSEIIQKRSERTGALRGMDQIHAEALSMYESGMQPISIALKTGLPFSEVMDMISQIPPIAMNDKDVDRRETGAPERKMYLAKDYEKA